MRVFSEAGTPAQGEKLCAFTRRTFLEYFAAGHLATTTDTPERLARALEPEIDDDFGSVTWETVGELAIQIKQARSHFGSSSRAGLGWRITLGCPR
jgi:hypothetical protein